MHFRRRWFPSQRRYRSRVPVLSVGNLHSGGSGKTPLVFELIEHFRNRHPAILSRGYKAELSVQGARVEAADPDGARRYGDEPWMLSQRAGCPVYVGRDRIQQMKRIEAEGASSLVVLDDGFQHLRLHRICDLVAINPQYPILESFCLPWGTLREPLSALKRASAVILMSDSRRRAAQQWREFLHTQFPTLQIYEGMRRVEGLWEGTKPCALSDGERVAGFCGIAEPSGFQEDLAHCPQSVFLKAFPDHHAYKDEDVRELIESRERSGASILVTTDKDWFKAQPLFAARGIRLLSLRIRYDLPNEFWYFLDKRLEIG